MFSETSFLDSDEGLHGGLSIIKVFCPNSFGNSITVTLSGVISYFNVFLS